MGRAEGRGGEAGEEGEGARGKAWGREGRRVDGGSAPMVKMYFFFDTRKPKQRQAESLYEMHEALSPRMRSMSVLV